MDKVKTIPELRFNEFSECWQETIIGDLGEILGGGTPSTTKTDFWKGTIPWVSSSDLGDENIRYIRKSRFISKEAIKQSATKLIPAKSILIVSRVGVGKVAINETPICTSQDFQSLVPSKDNHVFLAYLIQLKTKQLIEFNQGTSIKGFVKSELANFKLKIPSFPEQQKIAAFLTAVDDKIRQLSKKKTLLEQYKKGLMQGLFNSMSVLGFIGLKDDGIERAIHKSRNPANPNQDKWFRFKPDRASDSDDHGNEYPDWEAKKLGDICIKINSGNTKPEPEGAYFVYGSTGIIGKCNMFTHSGKFILIARVGANAGSVNLVNSDFSVTDNTLIVECDKTTVVVFIYYVLSHNNLKKLVFGSGQPLITGGQLKSLILKIPTVAEQTKIANFLSAIDNKINLVNRQLKQTRQYKKGLLQQMFV